jgi:GAF domain-containing protein
METPAATDERAAQCDSLQYALREGPCIDVVRTHTVVQADGLAADVRWPRLAPRAALLGVSSVLALRLFTRRETLGALNLYSRARHAFDESARVTGLIFASHAAVALSNARTKAQLEEAVRSRTVIGQAQGILMERDRLTAEEAFDVLRRASQTLQMKLRHVAERIVQISYE